MDADELTNARRRIDELDAILDERSREVAALRVVLESRASKAEPVAPSPAGSRLRVVGALLLATAVGAVAWVAWTRSAPAKPHYSRPAPVRVRVPGPRTLPPQPSREASKEVDPGFRVRVPHPAYVEALAARCPRTRPTLASPPPGTDTLDFDRCEGCACCGDPAADPPGDDAPLRAGSPAARCRECSAVDLLERAGVVVRGGPAWSPLHSRYGLVMQLDRPARFVALRMLAVGAGRQRDGAPAAVLIAYDDIGRPIDAARAEAGAGASAEGFSAEWTFVVEACPGEAIARVDHGVRNATTDFLAWGTQPAEPSR